jgi:hypothetical protein
MHLQRPRTWTATNTPHPRYDVICSAPSSSRGFQTAHEEPVEKKRKFQSPDSDVVCSPRSSVSLPVPSSQVRLAARDQSRPRIKALASPAEASGRGRRPEERAFLHGIQKECPTRRERARPCCALGAQPPPRPLHVRHSTHPACSMFAATLLLFRRKNRVVSSWLGKWRPVLYIILQALGKFSTASRR